MNTSSPHSLRLGKASGFSRSWEAVVARLPFQPKSRRASSTERAVESGELLTFHQPGAVTRITCVSGCLWITQEGDETDYVLQSGESFVPQARGLVLVEGMNTSLLRIGLRDA